MGEQGRVAPQVPTRRREPQWRKVVPGQDGRCPAVQSTDPNNRPEPNLGPPPDAAPDNMDVTGEPLLDGEKTFKFDVEIGAED